MSIDVGATDRTRGSAASAMRPTIAGLRHVVSAGHYLAAGAGFQVLEAGGNAIDAGVAAGIALAVVQSDLVSFAGVAPILLYHAESDRVLSVSGLGWWPRAARLEHFIENYRGQIPVGLLRTVVPAAPCAWITVLEHFGTMSFAEVASPAIHFAERGFVMHSLMAETITTNAAAYARWQSNREIYLPDGAPPQVGEVFRQPDLARTLRYMADEDRAAGRRGRVAGLRAARNAFYRGDIGRAIAHYHAENGGFLTMEDLAEFAVEIEPATHSSFRGIDVYTCGFWCQGPALLQMLNMMEATDVGAFGHNSSAYSHFVTEAMKLAFADREASFGDPRHVEVPAATLLSKDYACSRAALIRPERAIPGMASPGVSLPGWAPPDGVSLTESADISGAALDTSYVSVVDRHGNAFSATPSDASNNTPVIPGTGLCPSSRGSQSWARPGHPAAVAPRRRPRLTPNPAIAIEPGRWTMAFGSPGGDVQVQAMLQFFLNTVVFEMDLQKAVETPRFATYSFPASFEPHEVKPNQLMVESGLAAEIGHELSALGHHVHAWPDWNWRAGGVCAVRHDLETSVRWAAADPRRPSYALGL